jgi:hypothetical protein
MPEAYRTHIHVASDGTLTLANLPFSPGEAVEVIVLAEERRTPEERRYPLRGKPLVFLDPTAPVADSDWETLQ